MIEGERRLCSLIEICDGHYRLKHGLYVYKVFPHEFEIVEDHAVDVSPHEPINNELKEYKLPEEAFNVKQA